MALKKLTFQPKQKKSLLFDTHFDISTIQNILIFDAQYCKCVEQVDEQRNNVLPVAKPLS